MQQLGLSQPVVLKMQWKHLNLIFILYMKTYIKKKVHCLLTVHTLFLSATCPFGGNTTGGKNVHDSRIFAWKSHQLDGKLVYGFGLNTVFGQSIIKTHLHKNSDISEQLMSVFIINMHPFIKIYSNGPYNAKNIETTNWAKKVIQLLKC